MFLSQPVESRPRQASLAPPLSSLLLLPGHQHVTSRSFTAMQHASTGCLGSNRLRICDRSIAHDRWATRSRPREEGLGRIIGAATPLVGFVVRSFHHQTVYRLVQNIDSSCHRTVSQQHLSTKRSNHTSDAQQPRDRACQTNSCIILPLNWPHQAPSHPWPRLLSRIVHNNRPDPSTYGSSADLSCRCHGRGSLSPYVCVPGSTRSLAASGHVKTLAPGGVCPATSTLAACPSHYESPKWATKSRPGDAIACLSHCRQLPRSPRPPMTFTPTLGG